MRCLQLMREHGLTPDDIAQVTAHVHQGAIDVLGPVVDPQTVHQAKFSMGTVLGLIAMHGTRGARRVRAHYRDPGVVALRRQGDDGARRRDRSRLPARAGSARSGETIDGRTLSARVDEPKGDPGNTLSRAEIEDKALRLARSRRGDRERDAERDRATSGRLATAERIDGFLA